VEKLVCGMLNVVQRRGKSVRERENTITGDIMLVSTETRPTDIIDGRPISSSKDWPGCMFE
jgi:hypothetical protein